MIIQLLAMYQFGVIRTAATTDGKVTNRARLSIESEKVHRLYPPVSLCEHEEVSKTSVPGLSELRKSSMTAMTEAL